MIDVLLVLIIIFMVITPLTPKGLEALVPQPPPPVRRRRPRISERRHLDRSDHKMMINAEATDENHLGPVWKRSSRRAPSAWFS